MKSGTENNEEGSVRQAECKKMNSETEMFNNHAAQNKTEAKNEFYKRIQEARRTNRMHTEINF